MKIGVVTSNSQQELAREIMIRTGHEETFWGETDVALLGLEASLDSNWRPDGVIVDLFAPLTDEPSCADSPAGLIIAAFCDRSEIPFVISIPPGDIGEWRKTARYIADKLDWKVVEGVYHSVEPDGEDLAELTDWYAALKALEEKIAEKEVKK